MARLDPNDTLSLKDIERRIKYFRVGDEVSIPSNLLSSTGEMFEFADGKRQQPKNIRATVYAVCPNYIVFQLKNGIKESLINFDCMSITLIKASKNEAYTQKDALKDITRSFLEMDREDN